jgi:hypothetical protein
MERELWRQLYVIVLRLDTQWGPGFYRAAEIVAVFLWAVVHDRPTSWACQRRHWGDLAPPRLPAQSTLSRRLRTPAVRRLLAAAEAALSGDPAQWRLERIDSKPLAVGVHSKDRQATWGHVAKRRLARGYKLHAVWGGGPLPCPWRIESMNVGDSTAACPLLEALPGEGYVVGDKQYDSNRLHAAASPGRQLITPQRRPGRALGHRRHHPGRLRSLELVTHSFGQALLRYRDQIERDFSQLTCFGAGLGPLPSWVRGLRRVTLWVQAKLLINALRIINTRPPAPATA